MRELHGVSPPSVAFLRRAVAGLVVGSLLVLCFGQPFHPGATLGARDGFAVAAAVDGASLPHGGAHLPGLCSICRVIAQTANVACGVDERFLHDIEAGLFVTDQLKNISV
jgi:hypothetical protein